MALLLLACAKGVEDGDDWALGGTIPDPVPFDECSAVAGEATSAEQHFVEAYTDGWFGEFGLVGFTDQAALDAWWAAGWLGGPPEHPALTTIDFETEQAVGFVTWEAPDSGESIGGFSWSSSASSDLMARIGVEPHCYSGDDIMFRVEVWSTPIAPVNGCRYGERCGEE